MVSSCATGRRNAAWTDCPGVRAFLSHAPSGWSLVGTYSTERKKRANCSSAYSRCETTWDFSPRNTIRTRNDSWEISHRHVRMSHYLPPRESLTVNGKLRYRIEGQGAGGLLGRREGAAVATDLWGVSFGVKSSAQVDRP